METPEDDFGVFLCLRAACRPFVRNLIIILALGKTACRPRTAAPGVQTTELSALAYPQLELVMAVS
ncbi:Hypothetical protein AT6N2_L1721 [Agrobacterium tumefaciens]|uniref:Uncharacterized protein n=1 Tax=Agrobacterium tumefaciens TaxID=358 RepID=A0A176XC86_AGRTU|nr:hypothetical protein [Agrobacterium tumefaciens]OAE45822.1 hypothetical protein A7J57_24805 [Agrobacterium tumefaciens]QTK82447.1 Hypothetical protein AT6N2_L1721 [Agrobacterium tumefaciens]